MIKPGGCSSALFVLDSSEASDTPDHSLPLLFPYLLFKFFSMWTNFKVFIEFVALLLFFGRKANEILVL